MTMTRQSVDALIAERVAADPSFRDALVMDPRRALTALTGTQIPDLVTITVHEESPADIHLVLPSATRLNDEDLELVAGGWTPGGCASCPF